MLKQPQVDKNISRETVYVKYVKLQVKYVNRRNAPNYNI